MNAIPDFLLAARVPLASAVGPDGELIAVCARIVELERDYDAAARFEDVGEIDPKVKAELARIGAEEDALIARLGALPCHTVEGVQAMARALAAWNRELLRDTPATDNGEFITAHLVDRLLALPSRPASPDTDLLNACAAFRASEQEHFSIYEDTPEISDDDADALAAPIFAMWHDQLDRMEAIRATTVEGLAARALALAQHSGVRPGFKMYGYAFDPEDGSVTGRLLQMLLVDGMALAVGGAPPASPDADLLALRPEFERLRDAIAAENARPGDWTDGLDADLGKPFDELCVRIASMPPAVTGEGRALKAVAALHQLSHVGGHDDPPSGALHACWTTLRQEVGDHFPIPGGRS